MASVQAVDLRTGRERWDVTVSDYKNGSSMTLAPLAVKDKIIVGISGGEFGVRGFIDAYDAKTGTQRFRASTPGCQLPRPGSTRITKACAAWT